MSATGEKRHRQNERRRLRNRIVRSRVRTQVRTVMEHVKAGDAENAQSEYVKAQKLIDSAERKGVLQKNRAARQKSRLMQRLNSLQG